MNRVEQIQRELKTLDQREAYHRAELKRIEAERAALLEEKKQLDDGQMELF